MSKVLVAVLPILFLVSFGTVYADNPTPRNEYNFDFTKIEISQNSYNRREMIVSTGVLYYGESPLGSVDIFAEVISPSNKRMTLFGSLHDMKKGNEHYLDLRDSIKEEGTYTINLRMSPPEWQYVNHVFDTRTLTFTVPPNGFERQLETIGIDYDDRTTYFINNPNSIADNEIVHAIINIPPDHMFEKITVNNGIFEQDFPIDTEDIYFKSEFGFQLFTVSLVRVGNLLPYTGGQDTLQDYVRFTAVNEDMCDSVDCLFIDYNEPVDEPELPIWIIGIGGFAVFVIFVIKKYKPKNNLSNYATNIDEG